MLCHLMLMLLTGAAAVLCTVWFGPGLASICIKINVPASTKCDAAQCMKWAEELLNWMLKGEQNRCPLQLGNKRLKLSMLKVGICVVIFQTTQQGKPILNDCLMGKQIAMLLRIHLSGHLMVNLARARIGHLCIKRHVRVIGPNDPSSATRPAGRVDCNRDAMAVAASSCSLSGVNKVVTLWRRFWRRSPAQNAIGVLIPNTVINLEWRQRDNRRGEHRQRSGCWRADIRGLLLSCEVKARDEASEKTTDCQNDCSCSCFHKCVKRPNTPGSATRPVRLRICYGATRLGGVNDVVVRSSFGDGWNSLEAALKRAKVLPTLARMNRLLFGDNLQWLCDARTFLKEFFRPHQILGLGLSQIQGVMRDKNSAYANRT
jgi:hypothetical protein